MISLLSMAVLLASPPSDLTPAQQAEALFQRARALLKADVPADACPLLEKSHALDPALGTLMNLADCEERINHFVAAYMHFNDAAAWAERTHEAQRLNIARSRASALKPRLSWIALSTQAPMRALHVKVNGFVVELGATAQSVPVDAGEVTLTATADGFLPFTTHLLVAQSATVPFEVPKLMPEDAELKDATADTKLTPAPRAEESRPVVVATPGRTSQPSRTGPVVLLGSGAALLIGGLIGLAWSYNTDGQFERQQSGGPLIVSRDTFNTLTWVYPLSWVVSIVGALAVAAGSTWLFVPRQ
jgi:hypothetical protein